MCVCVCVCVLWSPCSQHCSLPAATPLCATQRMKLEGSLSEGQSDERCHSKKLQRLHMAHVIYKYLPSLPPSLLPPSLSPPPSPLPPSLPPSFKLGRFPGRHSLPEVWCGVGRDWRPQSQGQALGRQKSGRDASKEGPAGDGPEGDQPDPQERARTAAAPGRDLWVG